MRLLGRGRQESLIGAYEKPPAMPEDTYFLVCRQRLDVLYPIQRALIAHKYDTGVNFAH